MLTFPLALTVIASPFWMPRDALARPRKARGAGGPDVSVHVDDRRRVEGVVT